MNKIKSGGGITSNKRVEVKQRLGAPAKVVNSGGADQIGQAMGAMRDTNNRVLSKAHTTPLYGGSMGGVGAVKLGNEIAGNVGRGGPGAGRNLYGQSGTQCQHGPVAPGSPPPHKDILDSFGPEMSGPAARKR
jgi:hypothetical protein